LRPIQWLLWLGCYFE